MSFYIPNLCDLEEEKKPMTNADRIRAMSDKELVKFLLSCDDGNFLTSVCSEENCAECRDEIPQCSGNCMPAVMKWLQQPAEEADHEQ